MPSRPLARKQKGEWAECAFLSRALALGLIVSKPWGDSARYDFAVEGRHGFRRVQVKSCWGRNPYDGLYHVNTARTGNRRRYCFRQVDLIAAYIVPEDAWVLHPHRLPRGAAQHRDLSREAQNHQPLRALPRSLAPAHVRDPAAF